MTACVIDSSAILAFVFGEPGAETASNWLDRGAAASTVILQEVATKLRQRGFTPEDAAEAIDVLGLTVVDHTLPLALAAAGALRRHPRARPEPRRPLLPSPRGGHAAAGGDCRSRVVRGGRGGEGHGRAGKVGRVRRSSGAGSVSEASRPALCSVSKARSGLLCNAEDVSSSRPAEVHPNELSELRRLPLRGCGRSFNLHRCVRVRVACGEGRFFFAIATQHSTPSLRGMALGRAST